MVAEERRMTSSAWGQCHPLQIKPVSARYMTRVQTEAMHGMTEPEGVLPSLRPWAGLGGRRYLGRCSACVRACLDRRWLPGGGGLHDERVRSRVCCDAKRRYCVSRCLSRTEGLTRPCASCASRAAELVARTALWPREHRLGPQQHSLVDVV